MTPSASASDDIAFIAAQVRASRAEGGFGEIAPLALARLPILPEHASAGDAGLLDHVQLAVRELYAPRAQFLPGEFPVEALWVHYASLYVGEVCNGGHESLDEVLPYGAIPLRMARSGFIAAGAPALVEVLAAYLDVVGRPDNAASPLRVGATSPRRDALAAIDSRVFAMDRMALIEAFAALARTISVEVIAPLAGEAPHMALARRGKELGDANALCLKRRQHLASLDGQYAEVVGLVAY